ncbi:alpha/beta fold hydrolase [Brucella anthropi]|jgi:pimeloyl-ACP methyl ester carboxylesterase|uniref:Alpha/beta fold hydrolase n=1 Tax=Brucella anthropi TaxID=529 RepID=A0A7V7WBG0_BRUAN|nr:MULTISPECIES: alpha/beta fold hydrolase [Brucella/Ochrobactrum group]MCR5941676.1 alpha/beta fold hydrolase [Ochrobactrum sp. XJ1]QTN03296.1 alpha/beta fold hydrolase [Ochrobactrum sp. EEELCW01]KAB2737627.1 alpha/beta fold hydrolase [Brucella anthropi]KAB2760085.1 alpha/beta fold hydrolase [Brucella anthropi]KAB2771301.1 alpha/beta fold hydrolase [Brucella anthropi]
MGDRVENETSYRQPANVVRSAASPVVFCDTLGLYQAPVGPSLDTVVLFASPWGLEELCTTRKFWRIIADGLSVQGIGSFRFDWPGTGDGRDDIEFSKGLELWRNTLAEAARKARDLSGASRVIIIGQSLGAAIAAETAVRIEGIAALALLSPVISGRFYTRELAVWSSMVDADLGLTDEQRIKNSVSIASLTMQPEVAADVKKINLLSLETKPAPQCLLLARMDRPNDAELATHLEKLGADVTVEAFTDYDKLISNPVISRLPLEVADRLVDWAAGLAGSQPAQNKPDERALGGTLTGDGFVETPISFGSGNRLSGVLCAPVGERRGRTVLFLSAAYDRRVGWGRTTVDMARKLAREGIASLRFDIANAGDSPPNPGMPEQVLYTNGAEADVAEALDYLDTIGWGRPIIAGRCSGAFLGFHSALKDERISGAVLVNPETFYWAPGRSVEDAVRDGKRTLEDYGSRALRAETFQRLFRGELDIRAILRNISRGVVGRIRGLARKLLRSRTVEGRAVYSAFDELKQREVPLALVYAEKDIGREHFNFYFDQAGAKLQGFDNASVAIIPDADHNLTPEHSREIYIGAIRAMALRG